MPKEAFYPIYYSKWELYFDADRLVESLKRTENSIVIHVWNKFSSIQPILKDFRNQTLIKKYEDILTKSKMKLNPFGETAYAAIAKIKCPRVYATSGDLF